MVHVRGRNNAHADALSRLNYAHIESCSDCNLCHSEIATSVILNPKWQNTELDNIAYDVEQSIDVTDMQTSSTNVNEIKNLRYQYRKRIKGNDA